MQSWEDVPLKINTADLAFNSNTATLSVCHYYIFVSQTDESKFIYLNRPAETKGAKFMGRQYFMSSVPTEKPGEILAFAVIRLYYIFYQPV